MPTKEEIHQRHLAEVELLKVNEVIEVLIGVRIRAESFLLPVATSVTLTSESPLNALPDVVSRATNITRTSPLA